MNEKTKKKNVIYTRNLISIKWHLFKCE